MRLCAAAGGQPVLEVFGEAGGEAHLPGEGCLPFVEAVEVAVEDDAGGVGGEAAAHQADEQAVVVGQPWKVVEESAEKAGVGGLDEVADLLQCFAAGESGLKGFLESAAEGCGAGCAFVVDVGCLVDEHQQPLSGARNTTPSCDLLSFYYLCRTGNNSRGFDEPGKVVVICFHFTIFVVLETTRGHLIIIRAEL